MLRRTEAERICVSYNPEGEGKQGSQNPVSFLRFVAGLELGKAYGAEAPDCAGQGLLHNKSSQPLLAESSPLILFWTLWSEIQAGCTGHNHGVRWGRGRVISTSLGFSCEVKTVAGDGAFSVHSMSSGLLGREAATKLYSHSSGQSIGPAFQWEMCRSPCEKNVWGGNCCNHHF